MKKLTPKQMKIAKVEPPYDKITKSDFEIINGKKKRKKR